MASWHQHPGFRVFAAFAIAGSLQGCMGGPIARQIASSLAMQVADNVAGHILDKPQPARQSQTNRLLVNNNLDPYQEAFLRAELRVPPMPPALPAPTPKPEPGADASPVVSRLETVEIWGLIIGEEKREMLTSMRELGMSITPAESEWEHWQLAEGGAAEQQEGRLLILIPPYLGKMRSGDHAVIEIANGGLHIARDRLD